MRALLHVWKRPIRILPKTPRLTDGTHRTPKLISSSWSKIGLKRKRPENGLTTLTTLIFYMEEAITRVIDPLTGWPTTFLALQMALYY